MVYPGGDPSAIQLAIKGADSLSIVRGDLAIKTSLRDVVDKAPVVYQNSKDVKIRTSYILRDNILSYGLHENYELSDTLIIDPFIEFSTFSGSFANNFGFTATYDRFGFLYAGGSVFGQGYPSTLGAYDITFNSDPPLGNWGVSDLGITKYDTSGTKRIYSTYIGGRHSELPHSLIVNEQDELYIFGTTGSADYPVTVGAYDSTFGGGTIADYRNGVFVNYDVGTDIFVTKLNLNGTKLLGSTFFGGSGNDGLNHDLAVNYADQMRGEVILDASEQVVVATSTHSTDLPITPGAIQSANGGGQDGVVFKMNESLTQLIWCTYFGGADDDGIYSVITSLDSNIYVAGGTRSDDIPIDTSIAFQKTNLSTGNGNYFHSIDGFFAKINDDGDQVLGGSYYGSDVYDQIYFIREDRQERVYLFSQSVKYGTYFIKDAAFNVPNSSSVLTKFTPQIDSVEWSTTFGGGGGFELSPTAFMVDLCNKVYLSGFGTVQNFPITADAYQSTSVNNDFYFMVLEDDASALHYATFFGGNLSAEHVDGGTSRFDRKGVLYQSVCAGCQNNDDFPIEPNPGAVSPTNNSSGCNNGVVKFNFEMPAIVADFILPVKGCADTSYYFLNTSNVKPTTSFFWDFGDGTTSADQHPTHQYAQPGAYTVKLVVTDPTSCFVADSITKVLTLRTDSLYILAGDTSCIGDSLQLLVQKTFPDSSTFIWSPAGSFSNNTVLEPKVLIDSSRVYELLANSDPGCVDTVQYPVVVPNYQLELSDSIACFGDTILNHVSTHPDFTFYQWSSNANFSDTLNLAVTDSAFSYPVQIGDTSFYIQVLGLNNCVFSDSLKVTGIDFQIGISSDTIVCSTAPVWAKILSHSAADLDSISWSPIGNIAQGADSIAALLNILTYSNEYYLFARDTNGCADQDSIILLDNSLNIDLQDTTVCAGDTVQLGIKLNYNPAFTYEWLPNVVQDKDSLYTIFIPTDSTSLTLVVNNSFCIDSVEQQINVNLIDLSSIGDTVLCNVTGLFQLTVVGNDTLFYTWSNNPLFTDTLLKGTGEKQYSQAPFLGKETIYIKASDNFQCFDTTSIQVQRAIYDLTYPNADTLCLLDTALLKPNEDLAGLGPLTFAWSPAEIVIGDTAVSTVQVHGNNGQYWVFVESSNSLGCQDQDSILISFATLDTSIISLTGSPLEVVAGDPVLLIALPKNYKYSIDPWGVSAVQAENEFTVFPSQTTTYTVSVYDNLYPSCWQAKTLTVSVLPFICEKPYIYVPNAFSPNNDGENDVLYVRGKNIEKLYFAVFNRWGQKVFETEDQSIGWDGYFEGMKIDPAVYDYYLRVECIGEQEYFEKGNITLIR